MERLLKVVLINVLGAVISIKTLLIPSGVCRYNPTCSKYAEEAIKKHNIFRAIYLIINRLVKCNPLFPGGEDPVPYERTE
jgi:putative membrane protein insertion efficiency factor